MFRFLGKLLDVLKNILHVLSGLLHDPHVASEDFAIIVVCPALTLFRKFEVKKVSPYRCEPLELLVDGEFIDGVEGATGESCAFGSVRKDVGNFFGDAVLFGDVEVAHVEGVFERIIKY